MGEAPFSKFDRDPEALAWARAKVQRFVDRMRSFERKATEEGTTDPHLWRKVANLAEMEFVGGEGCVIAAFDERLPRFVEAYESAPSRPCAPRGDENGAGGV